MADTTLGAESACINEFAKSYASYMAAKGLERMMDAGQLDCTIADSDEFGTHVCKNWCAALGGFLQTPAPDVAGLIAKIRVYFSEEAWDLTNYADDATKAIRDDCDRLFPNN